MEIIVKNNPDRVDHVSRQKWYAKAMKMAQKVKDEGGIKFKDKGEEENYWKKINANPNNVPYLPEFFPPQEIKEFFGDMSYHEEYVVIEGQRNETLLPCGEEWVNITIKGDGKTLYTCRDGHKFLYVIH